MSTAALSAGSRPGARDPINGTIKASASLDDLQEARGGGGGSSPNSTATGRLGQSEMAARRLNFLLGRLQLLLGLSAKESCKAFFYESVQALQWTQRLLLRLWTYLLTQADSVTYRYQAAVFDTLYLLMLRGELDCSAMIECPASLLERYRRALWETTAYVIAKLSRKAAPTEVRAFCSQALALAFYRLPALRHELLTIILPAGESRYKHLREWNLPWSLHKFSIRESEPLVPISTSAPKDINGGLASWLSMRRLNRPRANSSLTSSDKPSVPHSSPLPPSMPSALPTSSPPLERGDLSNMSDVPFAFGEHESSRWDDDEGGSGSQVSPPHRRREPGSAKLQPLSNSAHLMDASQRDATPADQWIQLWSTRVGLDSSSTSSERILGGRYWRERLRKRGHCFFLFMQHYLQQASLAMGVQPGEEVVWKHLPGFPTLVKGFLIEMKQRPLQMWPESMTACLVTLLKENRQLLQTCVRILLSRVSALQLKPSLAVLAHLDTIMRALAGEPLPQTFSAEPLLQQLYLLAESEHFKLAASALIFLYTHLDALGEAARLEALRWLLQRFARFSLHWSRVVRTIFFHLAVIRVLFYQPTLTRRQSIGERSLSAGQMPIQTASSELSEPLEYERPASPEA